MNKKNNFIKNMTLLAMFLALCIILPFITGRIPTIGNMFSPMHIPVLLCGFVLGPIYGMILGFVAPIINSLIFARPVLYPSALCMAFELATYGLISGILFNLLTKKSKLSDLLIIYLSLIVAMITGRIIWGIAQMCCGLISQSSFTWMLFIAGAFLNAWPGIVIQIVLIPSIVFTLKKLKYIKNDCTS